MCIYIYIYTHSSELVSVRHATPPGKEYGVPLQRLGPGQFVGEGVLSGKQRDPNPNKNSLIKKLRCRGRV